MLCWHIVPIILILLFCRGDCRLGAMPRNKSGALMIELAVIYLSLQFSLPAALAVFPQVI